MSRRGLFVPVPDRLVDYRRHDTNATRVSFSHSYQQGRMWHKAWLWPHNDPQQRRAVRRAWRWLQAREDASTCASCRRQPPTGTRARRVVLASGAFCLASAALPDHPSRGSACRPGPTE